MTADNVRSHNGDDAGTAKPDFAAGLLADTNSAIRVFIPNAAPSPSSPAPRA